MKDSVDHIATMQNQATALANAYETGDKSVDLTKVMLEVQKAGSGVSRHDRGAQQAPRCLHASDEYVGVTDRED